jgi:hypothetical protein
MSKKLSSARMHRQNVTFFKIGKRLDRSLKNPMMEMEDGFLFSWL